MQPMVLLSSSVLANLSLTVSSFSRLGSSRYQCFSRQCKICKRWRRQSCVFYPIFMVVALHLPKRFLWDVATGKTIRRFLGHTHRVNAVDFNSDASVLASGSYDASVRLWDCKYERPFLIYINTSD